MHLVELVDEAYAPVGQDKGTPLQVTLSLGVNVVNQGFEAYGRRSPPSRVDSLGGCLLRVLEEL